jgi:hypothetical protein
MNSYDEESSEMNSLDSPKAFISSSNWENELSGIVLKRSSSSSFGSTGEVGGVEKGFDCMDERDGLDESFKGLECTGTLVPFAELAVSGRWSTGDMGGVCEVCVSCWRMFMDAMSLA